MLDLINAYENHLVKVKKASNNTVSSYMRDIRQFADWLRDAEEADVVGNGALGDEIVLEYDAELFAQDIGWNGADILPVNEDAAFVSFIQPHQKIQNGTLAAAGAAQDAQGLPVLQSKGQVIDIFAHTGVGEGNIFKCYFTIFDFSLSACNVFNIIFCYSAYFFIGYI